MENTIQIETFSVVTISQISKPKYTIDEEAGIYKATIKGYSAQNQYVKDFEIEFTQEEYDNWGAGNSGENYMKKLILNKLSFTEAS